MVGRKRGGGWWWWWRDSRLAFVVGPGTGTRRPGWGGPQKALECPEGCASNSSLGNDRPDFLRLTTQLVCALSLSLFPLFFSFISLSLSFFFSLLLGLNFSSSSSSLTSSFPPTSSEEEEDVLLLSGSPPPSTTFHLSLSLYQPLFCVYIFLSVALGPRRRRRRRRRTRRQRTTQEGAEEEGKVRIFSPSSSSSLNTRWCAPEAIHSSTLTRPLPPYTHLQHKNLLHLLLLLVFDRFHFVHRIPGQHCNQSCYYTTAATTLQLDRLKSVPQRFFDSIYCRARQVTVQFSDGKWPWFWPSTSSSSSYSPARVQQRPAETCPLVGQQPGSIRMLGRRSRLFLTHPHILDWIGCLLPNVNSTYQ